MSFRPPEVLERLWDLELRNGNLHRLQIVRFSNRPRAVVSLECREYIHPKWIGQHRPPIQEHDEDGFGMALTKGFRSEHVEWFSENREKVRAAMHRHKVATMAETGVDGWGRKI